MPASNAPGSIDANGTAVLNGWTLDTVNVDFFPKGGNGVGVAKTGTKNGMGNGWSCSTAALQPNTTYTVVARCNFTNPSDPNSPLLLFTQETDVTTKPLP
jgi:hypothetical protein